MNTIPNGGGASFDFGRNGAAEINITSGGLIRAEGASLFFGAGRNASAEATLNVSGSDGSGNASRLEIASSQDAFAVFGDRGAFDATVSNGGEFSVDFSQGNDFAQFGSRIGGSGELTVTDAGSSYVHRGGGLVIGQEGAAVVEILNGASAEFELDFLGIGENAGSNGRLTITDATLTTTGSPFTVNVGQQGTGQLELTNTSATFGDLNIGDRNGSQGTAVLSNTTLTLDDNDDLQNGTGLSVGFEGDGTLELTNGSTLDFASGGLQPFIAIGGAAGGTASFLVDNSTFNASEGNLNIQGGRIDVFSGVPGASSQSSMVVQNGGLVQARSLQITGERDTTSSLTVKDAGTRLEVSQYTQIGNFGQLTSSTATLSIENGAVGNFAQGLGIQQEGILAGDGYCRIIAESQSRTGHHCTWRERGRDAECYWFGGPKCRRTTNRSCRRQHLRRYCCQWPGLHLRF